MHSNYRHYLSVSPSSAASKSRQPTMGDGGAGCSGANVANNSAYLSGLPAPITSRCSNSNSTTNNNSKQANSQPSPANHNRPDCCGSDQVQQSRRMSAERAQSVDYWQHQQLHQSASRAAQDGGRMRELYAPDKPERPQLANHYRLEQQQQHLQAQTNSFARMTQQLNPNQLVKQLNELNQQQTRRRVEHEFCPASRQQSNQNIDHYASQIRSNQLQHRFQPADHPHPHVHPQQQQQQQQQHHHHKQQQPQHHCQPPTQASSSSAAPEHSGSEGSATGRRAKSQPEREVHVNFNRHNQASQDEDEGDSRKKKYLTAKYGQQQMNLIKKRLKIEMWLYEQLQELAKGSKSEAELDEIDIDLDQLLDLDDDDIRRRWLKKTLEPFDDLASDRIERFIDQVLEQSKLL